MNYADIKIMDIGDGPGIRVSLFVSGCDHHCKGCFNSEAWDYNYGKIFGVKEEAQILNELRYDYISGFSILGGEPLDPKNVHRVYDIVSRVKLTYKEKKSIWIYSGYTFEQLWRNYCGMDAIEVLKLSDVLVDGEFIKELHNDALRFKGSSNQRIIDLQKTINNIHNRKLNETVTECIVEWKE